MDEGSCRYEAPVLKSSDIFGFIVVGFMIVGYGELGEDSFLLQKDFLWRFGF
jgi:hypothetical protein